ncbi:Aminomethyltransferase, mitochondrial [Imshaugia aleurites]|uniref:Aminomethyltransferase n=1 Tax=Imshaugia aleurites TaxID=172621 RepID=A0A8H3G9L7_9LECA|nr:Aminomethyltransferase, mitochondrial [Imshaugia aleurites]
MVPFGGYSMPVQYADLGVGESHKWTREKASLFDVGHMVQHRLSGPGAAPLLETITPSSTASLPIDHSTLSCLLNPANGGIVDDTVITRLGPELFYLVTNAACKANDIAYLEEQIESRDTSHGTVEWEILNDWGLIALQGPLSADVLQQALVTAGVEDVDLKALYFGQCKHVKLSLSPQQSSDPDTPVLISRGGYTGEDGFEISIPPALTVLFTTHLLESGGRERLRLAGLGARDSLRLEAGMCLYGHDLDDNTTPVEAGLSWIVHKDRRASGGFHGDETILRQLRPAKDGGSAPKHRRVGLIVEGAPAREGAEIIDPASPNSVEVVGRVTSGCPSPTLGKNIAMGYIRAPLHKAGSQIEVLVRGKRRKAEVVKMPFVKSQYWKETTGTAPS